MAAAYQRPHVVKFSGSYAHNWSKTNQRNFPDSLRSRAEPTLDPITLFGVAAQSSMGRGDLGRTEMFTQTDFAFVPVSVWQ